MCSEAERWFAVVVVRERAEGVTDFFVAAILEAVDRTIDAACAYRAVVEAVIAVGHVGDRARGALGEGVAVPVTSGSLAPYVGGIGWLTHEKFRRFRSLERRYSNRGFRRCNIPWRRTMSCD